MAATYKQEKPQARSQENSSQESLLLFNIAMVSLNTLYSLYDRMVGTSRAELGGRR